MLLSMISDLIIAMNSQLPFRLAWTRLRHIRLGHPYNKSTRLDKLHSKNHPSTDEQLIYTVNVMKCNECGLTYLDNGIEYRKQ